MKKLIKLIIAATVINPIIAFAVTNQYTKAQSETPITCPTQIQCSKDQSISSCKAVGGNLEYWGEVVEETGNDRQIKKGTYFFNSANAHYQAPYNYDDTPLCDYFLKESGILRGDLRIRAKKDSNLEALLNTPTDWNGSNWNTHQEACGDGIVAPHPKEPQLCQFAKVPLIYITLNSQNYITLSAYANGILITKQPIYSWQHFAKINMYQAWDACSVKGKCTINFIAEAEGATFDIGNIDVDMDDKIKILQVDSLPSSGYVIIKNDESNAIEIKETTSNN